MQSIIECCRRIGPGDTRDPSCSEHGFECIDSDDQSVRNSLTTWSNTAPWNPPFEAGAV